MKNKYSVICILLGVALIWLGLLINVPGTALTTRHFLNGEKTDSYEFGTTYSTIDEYVGGDAYNFIIGATLVSGKMAGAMTQKAIYLTGGVICICIGLVAAGIQSPIETPTSTAPVPTAENNPVDALIPGENESNESNTTESENTAV